MSFERLQTVLQCGAIVAGMTGNSFIPTIAAFSSAALSNSRKKKSFDELDLIGLDLLRSNLLFSVNVVAKGLLFAMDAEKKANLGFFSKISYVERLTQVVGTMACLEVVAEMAYEYFFDKKP